MDNFSEFDQKMMRYALDLAQRGLFTTMPNPRVGCVIVRGEQIIAEGWHEKAGMPHAEIVALENLQQTGQTAVGATVYVSLEPCSHIGKTPPCVNSLIAAQVKRVFVAVNDPNPLVAGRGIAALRQAGIEVRVGVESTAAQQLNCGFFKRMNKRLPWFRCKIAASLDGKTALASGQSKWITGAKARHDGHLFRARACAILTGVNTVLKDNPQLNVRLGSEQTHLQPQRVIIDGGLRLAEYLRQNNPPLNIFQDNSNNKPPIIITHLSTADAPEQYRQLERLHIPVVCFKDPQQAEREKIINTLNSPEALTEQVDLVTMAHYLAEIGCNEVHVEAGAGLNGALLDKQLIDECLIYFASKIIGGKAAPMFACSELTNLAQAVQLQIRSIDTLAEDIRFIADCQYTPR